MSRRGIHKYLVAPSLLFLGGLSRREDLLRTIRSESRSAGVYELLAQAFQDQDYDGSMTAVFRKMAAEERWHAAVLQWCYRKRFGLVPSTTEALSVDCKTLNQALCAGLHCLVKQKIAEKQRGTASNPKWAIGMVWGFMRRIRNCLRW